MTGVVLYMTGVVLIMTGVVLIMTEYVITLTVLPKYNWIGPQKDILGFRSLFPASRTGQPLSGCEMKVEH